MMAVGSGSDIGLVRKANEDSFYIDAAKQVFVVADGMGGHENGKLASTLAVDVFVQQLDRIPVITDEGQLEQLLSRANEAVYRYQEEVAGKIMGTTFTAAAINADVLYIAHIGDSRAYRLREGGLRQLTNDHSYLAELVRLGEVEQAALEKNSRKNVLLKALGPEPQIEAQLIREGMASDDVLLLCTDGLYNALSDEEIRQVLIQHRDDLQQAANRLIALALEKGGADNITVVLYEQNH